MPASPTRVYVMIARKARKAVVLRRGPSHHVACIAWDLAKDRFDVGQWFKGRIYERRCDISPSGDRLVYFAANWKLRGFGSWTAISRVPELTAELLWPKGDAWGGGGLFETESTLAINHGSCQQALAPGHVLPRGFRVVTLGAFPGCGEDAPIHALRMEREGWRLVQAARWQNYQYHGAVFHPVQDGKEQIRARPQPKPKRKLGRPFVELEEVLHGIGERGGSWYMTEHRLVDRNADAVVSLGRTDWADWDHDGDLLFARAGRLYRLAADRARHLAIGEARELVDLRPLRFEAKPPKARRPA